MDLLQQTYELLEKSDKTYREIADGAGVGLQWFCKFKQRRIKSPGVPKGQAVYDFLRGETARSERAA